ncbi:hypothetical protein SAMN04488125_10624 [Methylorubrum salsuginis]|uniref:Transposase IS116/IS110/IS902 family protein n=1 Tax=Methylorubrum salsuginis TaxID=414703 RepID=A0A1I4DI19_9HYPH|nr:hypothetical protein SAMN04488125_10624 [Methylorubrum salsuginis]
MRHRLNRGGVRAANSALHIIAIGRLRTEARTKAYMARRIAEGHSKLEAIRCLKCYIAREVFTLITRRQKATARLASPLATEKGDSHPGRVCATCGWSRWKRRSAWPERRSLSFEQAISARTAGVVRVWGWMASINEPALAARRRTPSNRHA